MGKRSAATAASAKLGQVMATTIDDSDSVSETSMSSDDSDTESTFSVEDSDNESVRRTRKKQEPPAKRARRLELIPQKQAAAPVKRRKKSLLLSMPLDIIFEILGWLSVQNLMTMLDVSKLFHETLVSSGAKPAWKRALRKAGAKPCPSDLKEPRWAELLFERYCENCGRREQKHHKVDFFLRRRICTACKKDNLYVKSKVTEAFPDCDDFVLSLIPYTNIGAWSRGASSSRKFYWSADIADMIDTVARYKQKQHRGVPGAQHEFAAFVAERLALVEQIHSTGKKFKSWYYAIMSCPGHCI